MCIFFHDIFGGKKKKYQVEKQGVWSRKKTKKKQKNKTKNK